MQVTHLGRFGVALSAVLFAATACSGGEGNDDSLHGDTGAVNSASGDVAGANMASPAMISSFLMTVNTGEIEAAQLAQDKATNAQVKQYAQTMITDHRRANTQMESTGGAGTTGAAAGTTGGAAGTTGGAAGTTGGAAGTTAGAAGTQGAGAQSGPAADLQRMNQQALQTLQNTPKGRGFDSTYIALMVTSHQDVLTRLEGMRGTGGSASGGAAGAAAGGTAAGTGTAGGTGAAGTGNAGAVGSTGTTQTAGQANQGDQTQTQLQSSIEMVRRHLERAQEIQRTLQGGNR